jgi:hypothetical protein
MLLLIDLEADLSDLVREALEREPWGYSPKSSDTPLDLYALWFEAKHKIVDVRPRRVHVSREMHGNPLASKLRDVLAEIQRAFRRGTDLTPYLPSNSGRLGKAGRDRLLLHWGIRHLHVSPWSSIGPSGSVARSAHHLFFWVTDDDAYFLDVRPHARSESYDYEDESLLEIVGSNWPHLLMPVVRKDARMVQEITREQRHTLRRKNVNLHEVIGGRMVMPASGVTAAGSPVQATLEFDRLTHSLRSLERRIRSVPMEYFPSLAERAVACVKLVAIEQGEVELYETVGREYRKTLLDAI